MSGYVDDKRGGDVLKVNVEILTEVNPAVQGQRWVYLQIAGVDVFRAYVNDVAPSGKSTKEWARLNMLKMFSESLEKAMEVPEYDGN